MDRDRRPAWSAIAAGYSYEAAPFFTGPHVRRSYVLTRQFYLQAHGDKMFSAVADVASGSGTLTFYALTLDNTHIQKVYASDFSPTFIKLLDQRAAHTGLAHKIQSNVLDARQVHTIIPPQSVDVAFITFALPHVPEPHQVLQSLKQCLQPDGLLCVTGWINFDNSQLHKLMKLLLQKYGVLPQRQQEADAAASTEAVALPPLPLHSQAEIVEVLTSAGYELLHCAEYTAPTRVFESALDFVTHIVTTSPIPFSGTAEERAAYLGNHLQTEGPFAADATSIIAIARLKRV